MNPKSQSSVEFIILASFMLFVILVFFAIASSKILDTKDEANRQIARDIADFAYREIEVAKTVNDGYIRRFDMPETVNGIAYTIMIIDDAELVVNYLDYEYVKFLPSNVTGVINKGLNTLSKNDGIVYIN